jgi:phenylacetate-coenzyme A ligase PaaK-like adenylate-forming protein
MLRSFRPFVNRGPAMFEIGVAQLRFAASLLFGVRFSTWSLDRLVEAALATQREFGTVAASNGGLAGDPDLDDATRQDLQLRRFRTQADRAARDTRFYADLPTRLGLAPSRLGLADVARVPITTKDALRADPNAFIRRGTQPILQALTTGTTGRPTSVAFSAYELNTIVALSALGFLFADQLTPDDVVQVSTSARAVLGNLGILGACARIGAIASLVGVVEPAVALELLAREHHLPGKKPRVSCLSLYPSHLGELVEYGLAHGYRSSDFGLERIFAGGEIVTAGLKARAQRLFGPIPLVESYAMTETIPFGGTVCPDGHLHFEPTHGLLEVLGLESGLPVVRGEVGTIVATPFPPFRETTLLLRYDTEDVVCASAGPLTCRLRHLSATSNLLGKRRLAARHDAGWTFPRDVLEALEAVDAVPLPARCGFWAVPGGVAVEVVTRATTLTAYQAIGESLEARGIPLRALHLVEDRSKLRRPLPLRCDLKESSLEGSRPRSLGPFSPVAEEARVCKEDWWRHWRSAAPVRADGILTDPFASITLFSPVGRTQ